MYHKRYEDRRQIFVRGKKEGVTSSTRWWEGKRGEQPNSFLGDFPKQIRLFSLSDGRETEKIGKAWMCDR